MIIKLSTTLCWPLKRQIPAAWKDVGIEVAINEPVEQSDVWVIYQGMARPDTTIVPPNRVFFFGYEPPGLHQYHERFLAQFAAVVTCQDVIHPAVVRRHQAQPWLAGVTRSTTNNLHQAYQFRFNYDDFTSMANPWKSRRLSAICSTKQMVTGHAKRLQLVEAVKQELSDDFDLYGYGFRPLEDKWDALEPYTYHLVLENCCVPHYWSEKLADAYLASCFPIVWGCPNLSEYFPEDSFLLLDPHSPKLAVEKIREVIDSPLSDKQRLAIAEARRRILEEYNLFSEIIRLCDANPPAPRRKTKLRDERLYIPGGWLRPTVRLFTDAWRKR